MLSESGHLQNVLLDGAVFEDYHDSSFPRLLSRSLQLPAIVQCPLGLSASSFLITLTLMHSTAFVQNHEHPHNWLPLTSVCQE